MKETIKIDFSELAKSVSAEVKIEVENDEPITAENRNAILKETQRLFDEAMTYSKKKTSEKGGMI